MADKRISQLTEITTAADDDSLVILDKDTDVTKRIEVSNLVGTNSLLLKTASTLTSSPQAVQSVGAQVSALQISSVGVKAAGTLTATGTSTLASATLSGDLTIGTGETVDTILDEDTLGSDDPNALATQQSIKSYVDSRAHSDGTVTSIDVSGGSTGLTTSGGPVTASGTITLAGEVNETTGGTGTSTYETGDLLYASNINTLSKLSVGASDSYLGVIGGIPAWSTVPLGTVSSVAITGSDGIDIDSGSPITTAGTIALGLSAIPNTSLANSEVTIGSTAISLGATATTIAGLTSVTSTGFTGDLTGNVTATSVLVDGVIGTTQSADDNSTKVATTAYVDAQVETSDTLSEVLANGGTATSSALAGVMSDETGSGSLVFATSPTLVTPALGTPASGTLTNCVFPTLNQDTTGNAGTVTNGVYTTNNLSVLSATTSAQLAGVMSDETGTGSLVFASSPTLVTPALGTPASGVATNLTGTAAGLTAGNVTTNANLTGDVTSSGNATSIAAGVIVDADVKSDAAIAYSKLGTIPTWNQDTTGNAATVTTNANLTGEVTSVGNAAEIAGDVVDEANLKVSNAPTNGFVLSAQSGDTGGLTWVDNTHAAGTVTSVSGAGTINGLTLTGTVTSAGSLTLGGTLASVANSALTNSSLTVGSTSISLGGTEATITGLTLTAPVLGTPASGTLTNCTFPTLNQDTTGNAATVTTNANLTGDVTSVGNAATIADDVVDEANLKVGGTLTDDYVLTADTLATGGMKWAANAGSGTVTSVTAGAGMTQSGTSTINPTLDVVGTADRITANADDIDIASTYVGQTSITTLGTVATGTWEGTAVAANKGGTGQTAYAVGDILFADTTATLDNLAASTDGYVLTATGVGSAPAWEAAPAASVDIGSSIPSSTSGSVLFADSSNQLAQDNANFFWDNTNNRLGIGVTAPNHRLQILDEIKISSSDQSSGKLILGDGSSTAFNVGIARWNGATNAAGAGGIGYFSQGATNAGGHYFYTGDAAAGSQTERLTITSGGNVGIGVTVPDGTCHIHTGTAGTVTADASADDLIVENSGNCGISILSPDVSQIYFGTPNLNTSAHLRWTHTDSEFKIGTGLAAGELVFLSGANNERLRITSGGTVALTEVAAAENPDVAGRGQIWVKNDAPNTLWFTDDLGNDKQLDTAEIGIAVSDETTALATGDAKATLLVPRNMTITEVKASLTGADTGAYNLEVDVRYNATAGSAGTTIFSADLEITAGDYYATKTGATAFVGSTSSKAVAENGALYIDINDSSMSAIFDCTGLKVWLLGYWN